jgi:hypothetical protein
MTEIVALNRTLDQELLALMRGASLERSSAPSVARVLKAQPNRGYN